MIPLSDATIRFSVAGEARVDAAQTLIVNRDAPDWISPTTEDGLMALIHQYRSANESRLTAAAGPVPGGRRRAAAEITLRVTAGASRASPP